MDGEVNTHSHLGYLTEHIRNSHLGYLTEHIRNSQALSEISAAAPTLNLKGLI